MAHSASRLARSVANSSEAAVDLDVLSEAKSGQAERSFSMPREWFSENNSKHAYGSAEPLPLSKPSDSSAAFRQAARTSVSQRNNPPESANKECSALWQASDISTDMPIAYRATQSHQVKLAENLDGHSVTEFLSQGMPTSMSTGGISALAGRSSETYAQYQKTQASSLTEQTDPVAYLQGTTYATDMEALDHQVPQGGKGQTAATNAPSASPSGLEKAWNEHSASILEEWELNEAWDRAWMDTTWSSVQKKPTGEEGPAADPVLPSSKNLSYLLKPRI
ncbi:hypothetical protein IW140_004005 [Coemansia sp. RSA 1813]|nr:hypothetical protein LPJ74_002611 [Coemansia sp. RSA 1843]KAJ2088492.1 hypothetical protein IW138_004180 [Coemansia sp. RSA 986]KAJ2217085.1 hypothetical protein EV179_000852 [Coemansia sp. RSA 487]KAJ2568277.1 hypothetical protein IW140_004005 [Coemansia sp. RSA 1813]